MTMEIETLTAYSMLTFMSLAFTCSFISKLTLNRKYKHLYKQV